MIQLPSSEFTFGLYGWHMAPWSAIKSTKRYVDWLLSQNAIGYCNSIECGFRPRPENIAIMFEDDSGKGWNHIPKEIWKIYLKQLKSQVEN